MNMFIYNHNIIYSLLVLAGLGQILLAAVGPLIARMLGWRGQTARLDPLTRQVFWTYAAYILVINLCFGLISTLRPGWLMTSTPLTSTVDGFIAVYWLGRFLVQIFYFDRSGVPDRLVYRIADIALTAFFAGLSVVYTLAAFYAGGAR